MNTTSLDTRSKWTLAAAAAVVVVGGALWAVGRDAHAADPADAGKKAGDAPVGVKTAPVKVQDMPNFRAGIGSVTPTFTVTVKTRVDGQLDSVGFAEGQDVKKGQVIARLDPRTLQAQLLQAQATRAKDQATLANARVDLQRYTTLLAQDAATQQQFDTQKALVAQLDATVRTDDAAVNYAQVQLDFTTIRAPIGGRVGARLVDPGNIVHTTDTTGLVVINQIDPISVLFTLPDEAVQEINHAQAASRKPLVVQAFPRNGTALLGTGTLTLVNNTIDTTSGTVQLKASFPNAQHALWPGQFVNVRLVLGTYQNALTIPEAAVQRSQTGVYAYVLGADGQTVQNRAITLVQIQDGAAIVGSGVKAGERVVVDGQYKLKPGSHVVEVGQGASAPAAAGARK
jgi:multidrug efflux system membrane fusion protein